MHKHGLTMDHRKRQVEKDTLEGYIVYVVPLSRLFTKISIQATKGGTQYQIELKL